MNNIQFVLLVNEVQTTRIVFIRVEITVLITTSLNLTIVGGTLPGLITGPQGNPMVELNGVDQFVQFPDRTDNSCLWDLDECKLGLTISFQLKIVQLVDGKYNSPH